MVSKGEGAAPKEKVATPKDSKVDSKDDGDEQLPAEYPPIVPSKHVKSKLFTPDEFNELDKNIRKVPMSLAMGQLDQLVDHLCTYSKTDVGKCRAFYVWIASQDVHLFEMSGKKPIKGSALYRLIMIRAGHDSFNRLFHSMCMLAGIHCLLVTGRVKGASYVPGGRTPYGNDWCLVYVSGEWRIIDQFFGSLTIRGDNAIWAMQGVTSSQRTLLASLSFSFELDDFYFLTEPEHFIYDHYCSNIKKQLLVRPVNEQEFHQMARLMQGFFRFNMIDISEPKCTRDIADGELQLVTLFQPKDRIKFTYQLLRSTGDGVTDKSDGELLASFVQIETKENQKVVKVEFPEIGRYKIDLYVIGLMAKDKRYKVGEWLLNVTRPKFNCRPMPPNPRGECGPGCEFQVLGLEAVSHKDGVIYAKKGEIDIKIKKLSNKVEVMHTLESKSLDKNHMKDFTRQSDNGKEVNIHSKFPKADVYALKIYTKLAGSKGRFENSCTYFVVADEAYADPQQYPTVTAGRIGNLATKNGIHLTPISHPNPMFDAPDTGSVDIKMKANMEDVEYEMKLQLREGDKCEDFSDHVWCHSKPNKEVTFSVNFLKAGVYSLLISARIAIKKPNIVKRRVSTKPPPEETKEVKKELPEIGTKDLTEKKDGEEETEKTGEGDKKEQPAESKEIDDVKDESTEKKQESEVKSATANGQILTEAKPKITFQEIEENMPVINDEPYEDVFIYHITTDYTSKVAFPCPDRCLGWKPSYLLDKPRSGLLYENENVEFNLQVHDAHTVAVRDKDGKIHELTKDKNGRFYGVVFTGEGEGEMTVMCKVDGSDEYVDLLTYRVLNAEQRDKLEKKMKEEEENARWRRERIERQREAERLAMEERKRQEGEKARRREEEFDGKQDSLLAAEKAKHDKADKEYEQKMENIEKAYANMQVELKEDEQTKVIDEQLLKISEEMDSEEVKLRLLMEQREEQERLVREELKKAISSKDKELLKTMIIQFKKLKLVDHDGTLKQAEDLYDFLTARELLEDAVRRRHLQSLINAVDYIKKKKLDSRLKNEVEEAEKLIQRLKRLLHLKMVILNMDKRTMSEIRGYKTPPEIVHKVMTASLLILGIDEDQTKDWADCAQLCLPVGSTGLFRRVKSFEVDKVHPEIVARCKEIIKFFDLMDAAIVSAGAACFYKWLQGNIEEAELNYQEKGKDKNVKPAAVARQKEIFKHA